MRTTHRVLAYAIALGVAVQAMAMVWAVAGLGTWIMNGGVADASLMESDAAPFPEIAGFTIHAVNGMLVIPIIALVLMVLSFFTRQRRPIVAAVALFVVAVLQGQLGFLGHEYAAVGALHGLNALILFTLALYAARGVTITRPAGQQGAEQVSATTEAPAA